MQALFAIVVSALVAGTLDIAATGTLMKAQGIAFGRLLRFVASGVLGGSAFDGGSARSLFGLLLHFTVALVWATFYSTLSDHAAVLRLHPFLSGALYGVAVHLVMSRLVVPLSRAAKRPFSWKAWLTQLAVHILCVGIPIAVVQSYFLVR